MTVATAMAIGEPEVEAKRALTTHKAGAGSPLYKCYPKHITFLSYLSAQNGRTATLPRQMWWRGVPTLLQSAVPRQSSTSQTHLTRFPFCLSVLKNGPRDWESIMTLSWGFSFYIVLSSACTSPPRVVWETSLYPKVWFRLEYSLIPRNLNAHTLID